LRAEDSSVPRDSRRLGSDGGPQNPVTGPSGTAAGENYTILFLHTKSSNTPKGLGLRDDQFQRALDFKKTLDKKAEAAGGDAD
jgi:hypothetical protein